MAFTHAFTGVVLCHILIGTIRVGAGLAPVLRFSHEPNLRSSGCVIRTDRKFGLFSFSKYYRMSTRLHLRRKKAHSALRDVLEMAHGCCQCRCRECGSVRIGSAVCVWWN